MGGASSKRMCTFSLQLRRRIFLAALHKAVKVDTQTGELATDRGELLVDTADSGPHGPKGLIGIRVGLMDAHLVSDLVDFHVTRQFAMH